MYREFISDLKQRLEKLDSEAVASIHHRMRDGKGLWVSDDFINDMYNNFEGMSETEILSVMDSQSVKQLPELYREYLKVLGRRSGGVLFVGAHSGYQALHGLKDGFRRAIVESNSKIHFPEDAFVFLGYQGVDFFFFHANAGDNPPVYFYHEGDDEFIRLSDSLSSWFNEQALFRYGPLNWINVNIIDPDGTIRKNLNTPF